MKLAPQQIRTFFVSTQTWGRCSLFQSERLVLLLIDVLQQNRRKLHFELHEFVIMPDHLHLLLTPAHEIPLERAVQYIKGGFSYRARKELGFGGAVWQASFTNHRIRDARDYEAHRQYILQNPRRRGLPDDYPYCSGRQGFELDPAPPGLKPRFEEPRRSCA
ncbi:MAG TPA: transposase [Terriglobales bacterium]|jgi:putative transposase|nr:transposase [Terriglobales bacterium]